MSVDRLNLSSWQHSTNPVFSAYRSYKTTANISSLSNRIGGCFYNAFYALGHSFASLPYLAKKAFCHATQPSLHWTKTLIYTELTWICIKALWNYKPTMQQLMFQEARIALLELLGTQKTQETFSFDTPEQSHNEQELVTTITLIFDKLPEKSQNDFLNYVGEKIDSIRSEAVQKAIIELLFKLKQTPVGGAAQIYLRKLLSTAAVQFGRVLVIKPDQTLQFMRKETFEQGIPLLFAEDQFEPTLTQAKKVDYDEGVRFKERDALNFVFLENVNKVYLSPGDDWSDHQPLAESIPFLIQMVPAKEAEKVHKFFDFACNHWKKKILSDTIERKDVEPLINLCNSLKDFLNPLCTSLLYFLLAQFKLSDLKESWGDVILYSEKALCDLMLHQDTHISPSPVLLQMLTLCLQEQRWQSAMNLCSFISTHINKFAPVIAKKLTVIQKEFDEAWRVFPAGEHMDFCLALYKNAPKDNKGDFFLPVLRQVIPLKAREAVQHIKGRPPKECDEILALSLTKDPREDTNYFDELFLAHQKQLTLYQNACVQKILENKLYLGKLVSQNLQTFADALSHYPGPNSEKVDQQYILNQALELIQFANGLTKRAQAPSKQLIINYLKNTPCYGEAAKKINSPEAQALLSL